MNQRQILERRIEGLSGMADARVERCQIFDRVSADEFEVLTALIGAVVSVLLVRYVGYLGLREALTRKNWQFQIQSSDLLVRTENL
jgi:hypothetical protein